MRNSHLFMNTLLMILINFSYFFSFSGNILYLTELFFNHIARFVLLAIIILFISLIVM